MTDALLLLLVRLSVVSPSPSPSPTATAYASNVVSTRATDDSIVRPGWLGFLVFLGMAVALYFLLRSFLKHIKRIDFDEDA